MNWKELTKESQIDEIKKISEELPVAIFKHSTRCSISASAMDRLERNWNEEKTGAFSFYYLDLISYRNISNMIASTFKVEHQSPQLLIIYKGECIYHASHSAIRYDEVSKELEKAA